MDVNPRLRAPRLRGVTALLGGGASFVALFLGWPFGRLLWRGLTVDRTSSGPAFDSRIVRIAWFTVWQALLSTGAVVALALIFSAALAGQRFRGRSFALAFSAAPFALPTVVVGTAFLATFPESLREGWFPIVCAHTFFNVGIATRTLTLAADRLDATQRDAARTLGASTWCTWRTVTLPQLRATIAGIAGLVGTLCLTSFGIVLLLGGPGRSTVDVEIYRQALQFLHLDRAAALAGVQCVVIAFALWRLPNRTSDADGTRAASRASASTGAAPRFAALVLVALMTVPLVALLRRAFTNADGSLGWHNFSALTATTRGSGLIDRPIASIWTSLRTATAAAAIAFVVGCALSVAATNGGRLVRRTARALGSAPLAVSAVALGLGVLLGFSGGPFAWRRSPFLLPCVQAIVCVPFVVRTLVPAFERVPVRLSEAAQTLGASPWRAWSSINAIRCRGALGLAAALAFTVSLGEFGATSFLARPQSPTMPVAIARLAGRPGAVVQGQASALAVLLGALTIVIVGLAERQSMRSPE